MTSKSRKIMEDAKVDVAVEAMLQERDERNAKRQLCQGVYKNGNLCRNYAVGDGLCRQHGGDMTAAERDAEAALIRENEEATARFLEAQRPAA